MLRSRGEKREALAASAASAFAISRAAGPPRFAGDVFKLRRLSVRSMLRTVVHAVRAANRLSHAVLNEPLPKEVASMSNLKRQTTKLAPSKRMLAVPERAPAGADGLGYNVGLFRSFAPKQRLRAGVLDPPPALIAKSGTPPATTCFPHILPPSLRGALPRLAQTDRITGKLYVRQSSTCIHRPSVAAYDGCHLMLSAVANVVAGCTALARLSSSRMATTCQTISTTHADASDTSVDTISPGVRREAEALDARVRSHCQATIDMARKFKLRTALTLAAQCTRASSHHR
eukprot:IDg7861t1